MNRFKEIFYTFLKGLCIGIVELIPGISGGTIAFSMGLYPRILASIKAFDILSIKYFFNLKWRKLWRHINGDFILSIALGIIVGLFSFSKVVIQLISTCPQQSYAFFQGILVWVIFDVGKKILPKIKISEVFITSLVVLLFTYLMYLVPTQSSNNVWVLFFSGMAAGGAMLLPGISGSYILLILGKYKYILAALNQPNLPVLFNFLIGALLGVLMLARIIQYGFKQQPRKTYSVLLGLLLASFFFSFIKGNAFFSFYLLLYMLGGFLLSLGIKLFLRLIK